MKEINKFFVVEKIYRRHFNNYEIIQANSNEEIKLNLEEMKLLLGIYPFRIISELDTQEEAIKLADKLNQTI